MMPGSGVTEETLAAVLTAIRNPSNQIAADPFVIQKATTQGIQVATGIVGINLEAGSKKLFPALSPLRNRFTRVASAMGATAVQWRAITAINAAKVKAGVGEGLRNSVISTTEVDKSQTYKSFGLDDSVTFEAIQAGRGFEDVRAMAAANLMSAVMIEEEVIILGGNVTAIGKPASIAVVDSDTAGSLVASTAYDFAVSALTLYGYKNGAVGIVSAVDSPDETDARSITSFSTGGGKTSVTLSWPAVRGAVAYNVYSAAHSATLKYQKTVTATSVNLGTVAAGNAPNASDHTADALSFDGVIAQIQASGSGSYFKDLAGATLTGDNAGGIVEWDAALKSLWDTSRIGPTVVLVNSQEAGNALKKIAANGSTTTLRLTATVGADGSVSGGLYLGDYLNKYTQTRFPIMTHPYLAPGSTLFLSERLPFPNNNVPSPFVIDVRQEYTEYDWALVARKFEFGVYAGECLKVYFPAGCASIVGIGDG